MHSHPIIPPHFFNLHTVSKSAYLLLPLLFCTVFLFGQVSIPSDIKKEKYLEREKVNSPEIGSRIVAYPEGHSVQSRGQCDQNAPYYYNHADLLCLEENFLEYCIDIGQQIMNISWPGCEFCCPMQNPQWVIFYSGTESTVSIDISISQCFIDDWGGVKLSIYGLDKATNFDPSQQSPGLVPNSDSLVTGCQLVYEPHRGLFSLEFPVNPGGLYGLVFDGWANDMCRIEFLAASNLGFPDGLQIPMDNDIIHKFIGDTICLGGQGIEISLEEEVLSATGYEWWLNGELVDTTPIHTIGLNFTEEGINEICVSAYNNCVESDQKCIEIFVSPLDTIGSFFTIDTICVGNPFDWIGPSEEVLKSFPVQTVSIDLYSETYAFDSLGCPSTLAELFLYVIEEFSESIEITDLICFGESDGSVNFEVTNATPPIEIDIIGEEGTSGLTAGFYTYVISDYHGCVSSDTFEITQPPPINFTITNIGHSGEFDDEGFVFIEVLDGVYPYSYEWFRGDSLISVDSGLVDVSAGEYLLVIMDASLCVDSFVVDVPEDLVIDSIQFFHPLCYGELTGGAIVHATGGIGPYQYEWSTGVINSLPEYSGLGEGNFTVTVTDFIGFEVTSDFQLEWPDSLLISVEIMNPSCWGCKNGSATAIPNGDPNDFMYLWKTFPTSTNQSIHGLGKGTYPLEVTQIGTGCSYSTVAVLVETDTCNFSGPLFYNHAGVFCNEKDLLDYCFILEPTVMFEYWPGCEDCCAFHNPHWIVFQTGTDSSFSIDFFISNCQRESGFPIPLGVQLGVYELDKATHFDTSWQSTGLMPLPENLLTNCILVNQPQNERVSIEVSAKPGGLYGLVVDGFLESQCRVQILSSTNIGWYGDLEIPMDNFLNHEFLGDTICLGGKGIQFSLTEEVIAASGYKWWLNGELVDSTVFHAIALNFNVRGINEICVSAFNSCVESVQKCTEVYVSPLDTLHSFLTVDTTCVGNSYNWIGPSNEVLVLFPIQAGTGDFYFETHAIDSVGCPSTHAELFLHVKEGLSAVVEITDVTCHGDFTGSVQIEVNNATHPFEMEIMGVDSTSNLAVGNYTYVVTDYHGCVLTDSFEIQHSPPIGFSIVETGHSGEFDDEGYMFIEAEGGVGPYLFEWYSGDSLISVDSGLVDVAAGEYLLIISDTELCIDSFIVEIFEEPEELVLDSIDVSHPRCYGGFSGSATVHVTGGIPPFQYEWSTGLITTNNSISGLGEWGYSVTVTDFLGSQVTGDVQLKWPEPIIVDVELEHPSCLGCKDGSATVILNEDLEDFLFFWEDFPLNNSPSIHGVGAGAYKLEVISNELACSQAIVVVLTDTDTSNFSGPSYFNHTDLICNEEALLDYGLLLGPSLLSNPWPGCEFCCALQNSHWIRVVAGDTSVTIDFQVSDCDVDQGVQIGVYEMPDGDDLHFDPTQQATGLLPESEWLVGDCSTVSSPLVEGVHQLEFDAIPGQSYGLVVNGWNETRCKVEVVAAANIGVPEALDSSLLGTPVYNPEDMEFGQDTLCLGGIGVAFSLPEHLPLATMYSWTLNGNEVGTTNGLTMEMDLLTEGTNEVCVYAFNNCSQTPPSCIEIEVMEGNSIVEDLVRDTLCHLESYSWYTSTGEFVMELPSQNVLGEVVYETYFYADPACPIAKGELILQVLSPNVIELDIEDVSCFGGSDGEINDLLASGGLPPYDLILDGNSSGLEAGVYDYVIVDSWGCEVEGDFEVTEPEELIVDIVEMGDSGPGNDEGYVNIEVTGGTEPYSYEWRLGGELVSEEGNLSGAEAGLYTLLVVDANGCEAAIENIEVEMGVGFEDLASGDIQLNIFPNPAGDQIRVNSNVDLGEVRMTLYDIQGKILRQDLIQLSPAADLNISGLSAGVYFIQIALNEGVHTQKFVKF